METVKFQVFVFSITLYGGIIIGVLYDIYWAIKGRRRTKGLITSLWDMIFLLLAFFVSIWAIFSSNFGDLRVYVIIGFIVGFFLYERIIGRIVAALFSQIFEAVSITVKMSGNYFFLPLRLLWCLLIGPAFKIGNYIRKKAIKIKKKTAFPKKALKDFIKYYKLIIKRDKQ